MARRYRQFIFLDFSVATISVCCDGTESMEPWCEAPSMRMFFLSLWFLQKNKKGLCSSANVYCRFNLLI